MNSDSGNLPVDPQIMPGHSAQPPSPSANGPFPTNRAANLNSQTQNSAPEQKDAFREVIETVVFVVVLVLLLRSFMAEAFVIPTGSMATTLLGYHRQIECPECGFKFPVNLSKQMDGPQRDRQEVTGCTCPNCFLSIDSTNSYQFPPPPQP